MSSRQVSIHIIHTSFTTHDLDEVPLSTLIAATLPPAVADGAVTSEKPILGPDGCKRYFVVHGGLFSRDDVTLDEIRAISRLGRQPGQEGLMSEMLWTDPQEMPGRGPSKRVRMILLFKLLYLWY